MKVSVIIAVEKVNDYIRENIRRLLEMNFSDFEILLFVSHGTDEFFPKTRIITRPDLAFNPAQRRDLAINEAQGEVLAFIDDDAYPSPDWLNSALPYFEDPTVSAVGGPGVTPPEDSFPQQVSGWCSASPFGGGPAVSFRFLPGRKMEVQDFPSMNLIVRKSDFSMVGGFDSNYWPGEDTKLCLDLTTKIGKKIIYDPNVLVFHHRRPILKKHLKQNGRYGFHRGYFARILPQTSRKLQYFLPSFFFFFFTLGPLLILALKVLGVHLPILNPSAASVFYLSIMTLYFFLLIANAFWVWRRSGKNYKLAALTIPTIFLTHLWYGFQFILGLTSPRIKR